ncbi:MAG TPA: GNAT family N-acetyltransferase [Gemmatimonadales bacterium]|nr:GNAT family N-acetyltransferase [Gemmatimonadales bacterium]
MSAEIRILGPADRGLLSKVAPEVFDHDLDPALTEEFLGDPRHHLAAAIEAGIVVGFASAVHYVHPDKPPELWINEVGVAPSHRRQRLAQQLLQALFDLGHRLGCHEAWVLTSPANQGAMRLYEAVGGRRMTDPPAMFTFRLDQPASK